MATLSKDDLQKALEGAEGESVEIDGVLSQDEVNEIVQKRLAKEKGKYDELAQQVAQQEAAKSELEAKLQAIQDEAENRGKSAEQKLQAEIEKAQKSIEAWQQKTAEAEQRAKATEERLRNDFLSRRVQETLLQNGANPQTIGQAELVARAQLGQSLQVEDTDDGLQLRAIDPVLQQEKDLAEMAKGWLESNPHFAQPAPSGSGQRGGEPGHTPGKDSQDGMTGFQRLKAHAAAQAEQAKPQ
jgi:chromosome segregation ATPase